MPKDIRAASRRPYGNACQPCRKKKIGCDGRRPACSQCCKASETCKYIRSIRELRPDSDLMGLRLDRLERLLGLDPLESVAGTDTPIDSHQSQTDGSLESDNKDQGSDPAVALRDMQLDGTSYKVRRGGQGELIYYGVTSMPKGDPLPPSRARSPENSIIRSSDDGGFSHSDLPFLQLLATYKHVSVAPEVGNSLLDSFFCYSGPLYNVVDRMLFLRDMALSGPYFSQFLLMALYASGTRMVDGLSEYERRVQGDMFTKRAKELLTQELDGPSKVTTIQGLLVLSGRECAVGQDSQGWLHAGMAFRMIQDMGIHLCWDRIGSSSSISKEDKSIRDKLFWSAFCWDKTISLSFGREPAFPPQSGQSPAAIPEFVDDDAIWQPYYAENVHRPLSLTMYSFEPQSIVVTFRHHALLCLIVHDLITDIYGAGSTTQQANLDSFPKVEKALATWWARLPSAIRFEPAEPTGLCPPPYIIAVNLLYRAACILLHRSQLSPQSIPYLIEANNPCIQHSLVSHRIVTSFDRVFGTGRMSFISMYCSFVAAGVDVLLLPAEDGTTRMEALARLTSWVEMLEKGNVQGPSIRRAITTLTESVAKHTPVELLVDRSLFPGSNGSESADWSESHVRSTVDGTQHFDVVDPFDFLRFGFDDLLYGYVPSSNQGQ